MKPGTYDRAAKGLKGPSHPRWKQAVDNQYLHKWVAQHLGRPKKCEMCGSTTQGHYDWANKSHEYKRDLSDWIRLCRKCHRKYDNVSEQLRMKPKKSGCSSRFVGVVHTKRGWEASIYIARKPHFLGYYADEEEAALVYNVAAQIIFGANSRLNPV